MAKKFNRLKRIFGLLGIGIWLVVEEIVDSSGTNDAHCWADEKRKVAFQSPNRAPPNLNQKFSLKMWWVLYLILTAGGCKLGTAFHHPHFKGGGSGYKAK